MSILSLQFFSLLKETALHLNVFWCQVDLGEDNSLSSLLRYNPPLEQTGVTLDKTNFCLLLCVCCDFEALMFCSKFG